MLTMPRQPRRSATALGRAWLCAAWLFVALLSGMPRVAAELYAACFDCCGGECEGAGDDGTCPPDCGYGTCAKTISTTPLMMSPIAAPTAVLQTVARSERLTAASGVRGDVFHPPRA